MKLASFKPEGAPDLGWSDSAMFGLGIVEIGCAVLYLLPPTATLGAILVTGYLGGAVATHARMGDMFVIPIVFGAIVWLGLLLRDARLRAILPWRGDPTVPPTGGFLAACGKILLTLLVLIGVTAALIAALPADYKITRSITIDAPPSKVFEQVNDFNNWKAWSPWLKLDPDAKVTIEGAPGKDSTYKWVGNDQVGEGMMTLTESRSDELVRFKLNFIKPFEGVADSEFTFKAKDEKTTVTWTMTGQRDFKDKAIGLVMDFYIGGKFDEGLKSMKSVVEKSSAK
jgi:uncharacterized protein YndB with AHSA1/START domain